jgi:hypothetical protein
VTVTTCRQIQHSSNPQLIESEQLVVAAHLPHA